MTAETIKESEDVLVAKIAADHHNRWKADEFKKQEECIASAIRAAFAARPAFPADVRNDLEFVLRDAMATYHGSLDTPGYAVNAAHFFCFGVSAYAHHGQTPPAVVPRQNVPEGFVVVERRMLENAHRYLDLATGPAGARAAYMEINAIFDGLAAAKVTT